MAETLAGVGLLEGALSECVLASTFVVSCVEHVAMLQEVPHSPSVTTDEIRSYTDQADETIQRRLSALPEHLRTPLRDWIRFGRVQAWVVGNGPFPAGFGEEVRRPCCTRAYGARMEAARGWSGAPYSTVRAAYQGDVTWPATEAPTGGLYSRGGACLGGPRPPHPGLGQHVATRGRHPAGRC